MDKEEQEFQREHLKLFMAGSELLAKSMKKAFEQNERTDKPRIEEDSKYDGKPIESDLYNHNDYE